mmetsp:Transcript_647/g.1346  ORF Transcript_647/g.1346 Transcript_647/m.1346 type:complete len:319 (-) Transcript_647:392-1348(-)
MSSAHRPDPLHHLLGEVDKRLSALGGRVEHHAGQAVAGRLGQAHIAGDDGVEHLVAEVGLELVADLLLQRDARVEHHAQQADDLQVRVQVGVDLLDGVDQVGQAFEGEVLALHRHDHAVGAAQAVEREHRQRRRAVDQDEVVVRGGGRQRGLEAGLAALQLDQLDLGAGELAVGAEHVIAGLVGPGLGLGDGGRLQQHVVDRGLELALVDAGAHGGIALRVQVHHEHALADLGQAGGEVDGGGGLADATLLVGDAENLGHGEGSGSTGIVPALGRRAPRARPVKSPFVGRIPLRPGHRGRIHTRQRWASSPGTWSCST